MKDLEGYDAMVERILSVLTPEEVMRHYKPEQRLAGLEPEDYMRHFAAMSPEEQRQAVRAMSPSDREVLRRYLDETST